MGTSGCCNQPWKGYRYYMYIERDTRVIGKTILIVELGLLCVIHQLIKLCIVYNILRVIICYYVLFTSYDWDDP